MIQVTFEKLDFTIDFIFVKTFRKFIYTTSSKHCFIRDYKWTIFRADIKFLKSTFLKRAYRDFRNQYFTFNTQRFSSDQCLNISGIPITTVL